MTPETKEITCLSCLKTVQVKMVPYAIGCHIAICPECGKLAYNSK